MAHTKSPSNPNDFILPDLGEGVHEAELIKWRVQVGQSVAEHDILAEMETDKALVEVPSPRAGTIAKLHGEPGQILHVGNPLVTYEGAGGAKSAPAASHAPSHARTEANHASTPAAEREDDGTVVGKMSGAAAGVTAEAGKALATPAVRRLARDLGVNIDGVRGSGIGGRVLEKDVRDAAGGGGRTAPAGGDAGRRTAGVPGSPASVVPMGPEEPHAEMVARTPTAPARPTIPARPPIPVRPTVPSRPAPSARSAAPARSSATAPQSSGPEVTRIPFRGVRRTIANRLRESVDKAVHFNVMDEADVTELDSLRRKLAAASGEKISFLPFVASAICRVLSAEQFRVMNSTTDDQSEEILQHRAVHMGIATDTDSGLMVPVIRDCDALGVLEIGREISRIAASARDRSIPREQLVGGTFTISNVGSHAGRFATPILNYPEVGILAVGRARQAPIVRGGGIFVGNLLPLSLACDHRVVDGATGALALARIIELLQDPEQLLGPARE